MEMTFDEKLEKYIQLIIRVGLHVQKGQKVLITSPVECADFARKAAKEAFLAGAGDVIMRWTDDQFSKIRYLHAPDEAFLKFPRWSKIMLDDLSLQKAAFLSIAAADPEALLGVSSARISTAALVAKKAQKTFMSRLMSSETQWSVVSIPTENWAKKVFPKEKSAKKAMDKLWNEIFAACRIDESDAVSNWLLHKETLEKRKNMLNNYNFKSLHYQNAAGTDVTIELPLGHVWCGGEEKTKDGIFFMANIPTEEVFTAPKRDGVNGKVVSSKPLVYHGNIIDDFTLTFQQGKVIEVTAKKNQELLQELVSSAKNADYLGEVALVPYHSPISNANIMFFNTLYDENASCHLAFGKAYPDCVKDTNGKSDKELLAMGVNVSLTHEDFMIGTADLSIVGTTWSGEKIPVFVNGNFA